MRRLLLLLFLTGAINVHAQDDRRLLRGQVLYRNISVPNENVINVTSEAGTITNDRGEFAIAVKEGDELAFTAVNYQLMVVKITNDILQKNRLVVEVNEKVTELDEVVVTPDDPERFIQVKNEELKEFEYEQDRSTEVENIAMPRTGNILRDGLNLKNLFKVLLKTNKEKAAPGPKLKVSEVLRHVYDDAFFVLDLKIPQDKIDAFLLYCDAQAPEQELLRQDHEFQLIDFLVTQSKNFRETLDDEK
ncbi:carboxypeptidase-like regulatory domain-containing protein [Maribacter algicola]|uniref:Carboxypeptidase-like regulatory domain-containing protein n=1 Tax=Meishania litoralis TaxID=3434685 RepID=A0ACC7LMD9_9FLAO